MAYIVTLYGILLELIARRTLIITGQKNAFRPPRRPLDQFDLVLGAAGYQLRGQMEAFGPTHDAEALGTIIFALGLDVTVERDDPTVGDFANAMISCSASLADIEQGDVMRLAPDFNSGDIQRYIEAATPLCPSLQAAKEVSQQIHWLVDSIVVQLELRRGAITRARDWLQACFDCAVEFAHTAEALEHYSEPTSATASARCLAGYHLLRGAAKLYRPPSIEELEAGLDDEGPEDVRLGYVELGLSLAHLHFGERLKAWEFALRYKPALIDFEPDSKVVKEWTESISYAYISHFGDVLDDADATWRWTSPNLGR